MSTLLIITTGTTDVQIIKDRMRFELSKKNCGELLDQLVMRAYTFCDDLPEKAAAPIESLPEGDWCVCTPKLDAVLRYFESKGSMPDTVLILETGRSLPSDPRQAGAVLWKRLQARGVQQICRQVFLKDNERLEDSNDERDAVVRREVLRRLDNAIRNAFATQRLTQVYTALAGGIPEANDVIDQLVRLHAIASPVKCEVTSLKVPDGTKIKQEDKAIPELFHPAAAIRARWHALDLIQKGNLLAAWGAVSHLENQPGQEWTKVVRWLADFAASLPIANECDIDVLKHPKMAVRAALRVELALRAGDTPRAVHGTVAFFEAALWDWLRQRDFVKEDRVASGNLDDGFTFNSDQNDKERFKKKGNKWYINDFRDGQAAWVSTLGKPNLMKYFCALKDDIRDLRNDVAHKEPTQQRMQSATSSMQSAELWSSDNPPSFLSQPLVQKVLRELGEPQPETLCAKLIEDVRARLLSF